MRKCWHIIPTYNTVLFYGTSWRCRWKYSTQLKHLSDIEILNLRACLTENACKFGSGNESRWARVRGSGYRYMYTQQWSGPLWARKWSTVGTECVFEYLPLKPRYNYGTDRKLHWYRCTAVQLYVQERFRNPYTMVVQLYSTTYCITAVPSRYM